MVDGTQSQQTMAIGPSQLRQNLTRQGFTTIQILGTVIQIPVPEPPIIISQSNRSFHRGCRCSRWATTR